MRTNNYTKHLMLLCFLNLGYLFVRAQQSWQYADPQDTSTIYSFECYGQANWQPTECMSEWQQQINCNLTSISDSSAPLVKQLGSYIFSFSGSTTLGGQSYSEGSELACYQNTNNSLTANGKCIVDFFKELNAADKSFTTRVLSFEGTILALVLLATLYVCWKIRSAKNQTTPPNEKSALFAADSAPPVTPTNAAQQEGTSYSLIV